jgi:hypothetical protein
LRSFCSWVEYHKLKQKVCNFHFKKRKSILEPLVANFRQTDHWSIKALECCSY